MLHDINFPYWLSFPLNEHGNLKLRPLETIEVEHPSNVIEVSQSLIFLNSDRSSGLRLEIVINGLSDISNWEPVRLAAIITSPQ